MGSVASELEARIRDLLPDLERVCTDIHAHPELSMHETRTAGIAADRLRAAGFDVTTGVGTTGVVGRARQPARRGRPREMNRYPTICNRVAAQ